MGIMDGGDIKISIKWGGMPNEEGVDRKGDGKFSKEQELLCENGQKNHL